jgi:predicted HNH restriction endonuclease
MADDNIYYSDYMLAKWSRIVRIRDGHVCWMCEEDSTKETSTLTRRVMHAHHLDPKHLYPEKALDLNNGICLCNRCHLEVVHTTVKSHKKYRVIFKRHVRRKAYREFNEQYQYKLTYIK